MTKRETLLTGLDVSSLKKSYTPKDILNNLRASDTDIDFESLDKHWDSLDENSKKAIDKDTELLDYLEKNQASINIYKPLPKVEAPYSKSYDELDTKAKSDLDIDARKRAMDKRDSFIGKIARAIKSDGEEEYNTQKKEYEDKRANLLESKTKNEELAKKLSDEKTTIDSLNKEEIELLRDKYSDNTTIFNLPMFKSDVEVLDTMKELQSIADTPTDMLSKKQKDTLRDQNSALVNAFNDGSLPFVDDTEDVELERQIDRFKSSHLTQDAQDNLVKLESVQGEKSLHNALFQLATGKSAYGEEADEKDLKLVKDFITKSGFDSIKLDVDTGEYYATLDGEDFYIPTNFTDNIAQNLENNLGEIVFGIGTAFIPGGAVATGGKVASKIGSLLLKTPIRRGALGASIGAGVDYTRINDDLGREGSASEAIGKMTEAYVVDLTAGKALELLGVGAKNIYYANKTDIAQNVADKLKNPISNVSRFLGGDLENARSSVFSGMTSTQRESINDFAKHFGGGIEIKEVDYGDLIAKFGEDSKIVKSAKAYEKIMANPKNIEAQSELLAHIRSGDPSFVSFLSKLASENDNARNNLKNILNTTTNNLVKRFNELGIRPIATKQILDSYEQGTKDAYAKVMDEISTKFVNEKITLSSDLYENILKALDEEGITKKESLDFLNFATKNIYSKDGVTFKRLNNALKNINSYYVDPSKPLSYQNAIKNAVNNFVRRDIKDAMDKILQTDPDYYKELSTLLDSTFRDYSMMKDITKLAEVQKAKNNVTTANEAIDSIIKLGRGQGDGLNTPLHKILNALPTENRAVLEMAILDRMMRVSLKEFETSGITTLDATSFLKNINSLAKDSFTTPQAKNFIELAYGFEKLFKNDILIAKQIQAANVREAKTGLATSIKGAVAFRMVTKLFGTIIRLLPKLPLDMLGVNDATSRAALNFHLKKLLQNDINVLDFTNDFKNVINNGAYNKATKSKANDIIKAIQEEQDILLKDINGDTPPPPKPNALELSGFGPTIEKYKKMGSKGVIKLLELKKGHIPGCFYREDIGDIDIIYGDSKIGLRKIKEKHQSSGELDVFGEGDTAIAEAISSIIKDGILYKENNVLTIHLYKDGSYYSVGLSNPWNSQNIKDHWVITTYKQTRLSADEITNKLKGNTTNLYANSSEFNPALTSADGPLKSDNTIKKVNESTPPEIKEEPKLDIEDRNKDIVLEIDANEYQKTIYDILIKQHPKGDKKAIREMTNDRVKDFISFAKSGYEQILDDQYRLFKKGFDVKINVLKDDIEHFKKYGKRDLEAENIDLLNAVKELINNKPKGYTKKVEAIKQEIQDNKRYIDDPSIKIKEMEAELEEYQPPHIKAWERLDNYIDILNKDFVTLAKDTKSTHIEAMIQKTKKVKEFIELTKKKGNIRQTDPREIIKNNEELAHKIDEYNFYYKYDDIFYSPITTDRYDMSFWRKEAEKDLGITPIEHFGTNYTEYYMAGADAIKKVELEEKGQVAGAFFRKDIGEIDIVWGEALEDHKGYGLAHILDKHKDFDLQLIAEIINNGEIQDKKNQLGKNIIYKNYIVGINIGWDKSIKNKWVVTAFNKTKEAKAE